MIISNWEINYNNTCCFPDHYHPDLILYLEICVFNFRMSSCHSLTLILDLPSNSNRSTFNLHGRVPGGVCVVFASDQLIYD